MNFQRRNLLRRTLILLFLFALSAGLLLRPNSSLTPVWAQGGSATLSPALSAHIAGLANDADAGMVIVAFKTSNGLSDAHLNVLRSVGDDRGSGPRAGREHRGKIAVVQRPHDVLHASGTRRGWCPEIADRWDTDTAERRYAGFGRR